MKKTDNIVLAYNLYVNDLVTYALYLGFEKEAAMDAVHDVFYKIIADEPALESIENIKFFLFKSLKNRLIDIYKKNRQQINLSKVDNAQEMPFSILVTIEDRLIDGEEQQMIKSQIEAMLDTLTERQREIIYLRYIQEYDYRQISELLNISIHGCRKLVSKAIQSLREKYAPLLLFILLP